MARLPQAIDKDLTLSLRLEWHVANCLRLSKGCAVLVLQLMGPGSPRAARISRTRPGQLPEGRLGEVAMAMRPLLRRSDVVEVEERFGIGMVLPGAGPEGIQSVRQRLRRTLEEGQPGRPGYEDAARRLELLLGYASLVAIPDASRLPTRAHDVVAAACEPRMLLSVAAAGPQGKSRMAHDPQPGSLAATLAPVHPAPPPSHDTVGRDDPGRPSRSSWRTARLSGLHLLPAGPDARATYDGLRQRADALGIPYICLPACLPDACCQAITAQLAQELRAVPIGRTRGTLTVAMQDPTNVEAMQRLGVATGLTIFPVLASAGELDRALEQMALAVEREG
jgi:hypothetical protein